MLGLVSSVISFITNIFAWLNRRSDRNAGKNEQIVSSLENSLTLQKKMQDASVNSPVTVTELLEKLKKGDV